MKIGDTVLILIGPYSGRHAIVKSIELNAGARNGWFTVMLPSGKELLYAGEELRAVV